jgi:hypothetical protein
VHLIQEDQPATRVARQFINGRAIARVSGTLETIVTDQPLLEDGLSTEAAGFDLERIDELGFYDRTDLAGEQGSGRIFVTEPEQRYLAAWWSTGHRLACDHDFSHRELDLVTKYRSGRQPEPSFAERLQVQRCLRPWGAAPPTAVTGPTWTREESNE